MGVPHGVLPTLENLIKLAKLTEVQMDWLATGRGRRQFVENPDDVLGVIVDSYAHDHDEADILIKYRGLKASEKKVMHDLLKIMSRKKEGLGAMLADDCYSQSGFWSIYRAQGPPTFILNLQRRRPLATATDSGSAGNAGAFSGRAT